MRISVKIIAALLIIISICRCNEVKKQTNTVSAPERTDTALNMASMKAVDSASYICKQLEVKGEVENPLILTVDSLKAMKTDTINVEKSICQNSSNNSGNRVYTGVLLKDILDKAKIKRNNHKDRNFYIVARATDNYKATFSWAELYINSTGDNTYVVFEENGLPIKNRGEMMLICTGDPKPIRHVLWLKSIEIYRVN